MTQFIAPIARISPIDQAGVSTFHVPQSTGESLEQRMLEAMSERAAKCEATEAGIANEIRQADGSPQAYMDIQRHSAQYFLEMSAYSTGVRKACAAVETLIKA
jgi:hypothetical protein